MASITGTTGDDILTGTAVADTISGLAGNDTLNGGDGDDILIGGAGADALFGGNGVDTASYAGANAVTVNLFTGVRTGDAAGDTYDSIERFLGSSANDTFVAGPNHESLDGSAGTGDTVSFVNSTAAVNVNITTGVASGGFADGATIRNFETIFGSDFNDTIASSTASTNLYGGLGDDTYIVGLSTVSVWENTGAGNDTVLAAVSFSLATFLGVENLTYTGISNFTGTGNALDNVITGGVGVDTLEGGAGADTLNGGDGDDTLRGGAGADVLNGGNGIDTASYTTASFGVTVNLATGVNAGDAAGDTFSGIERFVGSTFNDTFVSGAGGDYLDGWTGTPDTLSYAASNAAVNVNLTTNVVSGGYAEGDTIRNFETVFGSAFNDVLTTTTAGHNFYGGAGDDTYIVSLQATGLWENAGEGVDTVQTSLATYSLASYANVENLIYTGAAAFNGTGNAQDNVITGGASNDTLTGGGGNDTLNGGDGNDTLIGGAGADVLNGGDGTDSVSYATATTAVQINLATNVSTGDAVGDTFTSIENIVGTNFNDTFVASAAAENLDGGGGVADVLSYAASTSAVSVNLTTNVVSGGYAQGDVVKNFERAYGSAFNDTLASSTSGHNLIGGAGDDTYVIGNASVSISENLGEGVDTIVTGLATFALPTGGEIENLTYSGSTNFTGIGNALNNVITGGDASDTLSGGAGADTLIGGGGYDTASYNDATTALLFNFSGASPAISGIGAGDTFNSIEAFVGTNYNDTVFFGSSTYTFNTGLGIDLVSYRFASSSVSVDVGSGLITGAEIFEGSAFDDSLMGTLGTEIFIGGAGADNINGGGGLDSVWYLTSSAPVNVSLATQSATGGDAEGDHFTSIENVLGSFYDDTITGDGAANKLEGGAGNDTIYGGDGDDVIYGAWITDTGPLGTANPGPQADIINGGGGNDTIVTNSLFSATLDAGSEVHGGLGNDNITVGSATAWGDDGNDAIIGKSGYAIDGGAGDDTLTLNGGGAAEGGEGSDTFHVYSTARVDISDQGAAGTDIVWLYNVANFNDIRTAVDGDDLLITNAADANDNGVFDSGVRIVGYYASGVHSIETFYTANGVPFAVS